MSYHSYYNYHGAPPSSPYEWTNTTTQYIVYRADGSIDYTTPTQASSQRIPVHATPQQAPLRYPNVVIREPSGPAGVFDAARPSSYGGRSYEETATSTSYNQSANKAARYEYVYPQEESGSQPFPRAIQRYFCFCGQEGKRYCNDFLQPYFIWYDTLKERFHRPKPFDGLEQPTDGHFCPHPANKVDDRMGILEAARKQYGAVLKWGDWTLWWFDTEALYQEYRR